jgi:hypothetical protein
LQEKAATPDCGTYFASPIIRRRQSLLPAKLTSLATPKTVKILMTPERHDAYREPPFPFDGATEDQFQKALAAAALRNIKSLDSLRNAVRVCVQELHRAGMTPEGAILTMRAYLRHTARTHFDIPIGERNWELDSICEQFAAWCIEDYYSKGLS